jgi:hypothetical protein
MTLAGLEILIAVKVAWFMQTWGIKIVETVTTLGVGGTLSYIYRNNIRRCLNAQNVITDEDEAHAASLLATVDATDSDEIIVDVNDCTLCVPFVFGAHLAGYDLNHTLIRGIVIPAPELDEVEYELTSTKNTRKGKKKIERQLNSNRKTSSGMSKVEDTTNKNGSGSTTNKDVLTEDDSKAKMALIRVRDPEFELDTPDNINHLEPTDNINRFRGTLSMPTISDNFIETYPRTLPNPEIQYDHSIMQLPRHEEEANSSETSSVILGYEEEKEHEEEKIKSPVWTMVKDGSSVVINQTSLDYEDSIYDPDEEIETPPIEKIPIWTMRNGKPVIMRYDEVPVEEPKPDNNLTKRTILKKPKESKEEADFKPNSKTEHEENIVLTTKAERSQMDSTKQDVSFNKSLSKDKTRTEQDDNIVEDDIEDEESVIETEVRKLVKKNATPPFYWIMPDADYWSGGVFFPKTRPVLVSVVHPFMASYGALNKAFLEDLTVVTSHGPQLICGGRLCCQCQIGGAYTDRKGNFIKSQLRLKNRRTKLVHDLISRAKAKFGRIIPNTEANRTALRFYFNQTLQNLTLTSLNPDFTRNLLDPSAVEKIVSNCMRLIFVPSKQDVSDRKAGHCRRVVERHRAATQKYERVKGWVDLREGVLGEPALLAGIEDSVEED